MILGCLLSLLIIFVLLLLIILFLVFVGNWLIFRLFFGWKRVLCRCLYRELGCFAGRWSIRCLKCFGALTESLGLLLLLRWIFGCFHSLFRSKSYYYIIIVLKMEIINGNNKWILYFFLIILLGIGLGELWILVWI